MGAYMGALPDDPRLEAIAEAWPDASFIKTRGLGHRRIIHDKGVINDIVSFLDDAD